MLKFWKKAIKMNGILGNSGDIKCKFVSNQLIPLEEININTFLC